MTNPKTHDEWRALIAARVAVTLAKYAPPKKPASPSSQERTNK